MASVRGLLNIQSLNESTHENTAPDTLGQAALTHAQITQAITWHTLQPKDDENESDEDEDTTPALGPYHQHHIPQPRRMDHDSAVQDHHKPRPPYHPQHHTALHRTAHPKLPIGHPPLRLEHDPTPLPQKALHLAQWLKSKVPPAEAPLCSKTIGITPE